MRFLATFALLLLAGCGVQQSEAGYICEAATQGLLESRTDSPYSRCVQEVNDARRTAGHTAAQKYRNQPRPGTTE